jgi:UDP-N-acetylmuramate dehydrogenase
MKPPFNPLLNHSLRQRNTLGFEVNAQYALSIQEANEVPSALAFAKDHGLPYRVLGGGSNVVLPNTLRGLTLLMDIDFMEVHEKAEADTLIRVGAGTQWHAFVAWTLEQGYLGLENLALIPGTVGAAPIQNIGAYGVEVKDYIDTVEAYDRETGSWVKLSNADCHFRYRHSLFKDDPKRYVITAVVFRLPKTWQPRIGYADLKSFFANVPDASITAQAIFDAVCAIRTQKLPDPKQIGNVGSFFQNPIVPNEQLQTLKESFPQIVSYSESTTHSKLAAGWLIDQCGFKGMQVGNVGVHTNQALVLTHFGNGNSDELLKLATHIQRTVKDRFGVDLVIEPVIF